MKIDNNALNLAPSLEQTAQTSRSSIKGHHSDHGGRRDQVQLSDLASQLSAQVSTTDSSRLALLQAAYEAGTYDVAPHRIASSIIDEMTTMK